MKKTSDTGRYLTVTLFVFSVLAAPGCKGDWAARIGIVQVAKTIIRPFPSYPLDRLKEAMGEEPPSFSFAVVGRTGLGGSGKRSQENFSSCLQIVETVSRFKPRPRFLVHLGDISWSPSTAREAWAQLDSLSTSLFFGVPGSLEELAGSTHPFLLALPGERDVTDRGSEDSFLQVLGFSRDHIYFSFFHEVLHFLVLNSEEVDEGIAMQWFGWNRERNRIRGAQLRWLQNELARSEAMPKVVFLHKPFFTPAFSSHEGYCMDQYYWDRERVLRLFRKHHVVAVFSGHETVFSHCQIDGIHHFVVGGSGRLPSRKPGGFRQFLLVAVYGAERMRVFTINMEEKRVEDAVWIQLRAGLESPGGKRGLSSPGPKCGRD